MPHSATTNLYEILGIQKNATQEEVRKAYKKRALQTHPDRLPQNIGPADKQAAEEQFRLVNNAYEVLNNEDNRKLYDRHGVWPPPTEQPTYHHTDNRNSFINDPFANGAFFNSPFGPRSHRGYAFTDPFELFNSLFGDLHSAFENDLVFVGTPFFRSPFDDPFFRSPFGGPSFGGSMFGGSMFGPSPFAGMLMGGSMFPQVQSGSSGRIYSSSTEAVGRNGQWVSRSQMTRTINGRTEVITKRVDAEGNEHITYSSPEGERYTINGIEQPSHSGRTVEAPGRPETASQPRQLPQAITDVPAQPASYYIPQQQQSQAYNVPISGASQTQVPPPNNPYLDRAHSHRSRHSSHRDRPSAEEAPRRSYTTPTSAERLYGGHDPAAAATANGYDAGRNDAYARDLRRDSGLASRSVNSEKTRYPHQSRHDSRSPEYRQNREREGAPPAAEQLVPNHDHKHSRRGWRGW